MDCPHCREALPEYRAEALPASERLAVAAHLDGCLACRRELDREAQLVACLSRLPVCAPPPGFLNQVLAQARREGLVSTPAARPLAPAGGWLRAWLALAASAACVPALVAVWPLLPASLRAWPALATDAAGRLADQSVGLLLALSAGAQRVSAAHEPGTTPLVAALAAAAVITATWAIWVETENGD